jgi:hypothetical protein
MAGRGSAQAQQGSQAIIFPAHGWCPSYRSLRRPVQSTSCRSTLARSPPQTPSLTLIPCKGQKLASSERWDDMDSRPTPHCRSRRACLISMDTAHNPGALKLETTTATYYVLLVNWTGAICTKWGALGDGVCLPSKGSPC